MGSDDLSVDSDGTVRDYYGTVVGSVEMTSDRCGGYGSIKDKDGNTVGEIVHGNVYDNRRDYGDRYVSSSISGGIGASFSSSSSSDSDYSSSSSYSGGSSGGYSSPGSYSGGGGGSYSSMPLSRAGKIGFSIGGVVAAGVAIVFVVLFILYMIEQNKGFGGTFAYTSDTTNVTLVFEPVDKLNSNFTLTVNNGADILKGYSYTTSQGRAFLINNIDGVDISFGNETNLTPWYFFAVFQDNKFSDFTGSISTHIPHISWSTITLQ